MRSVFRSVDASLQAIYRSRENLALSERLLKEMTYFRGVLTALAPCPDENATSDPAKDGAELDALRG
jgi:hypothetical protein